MIRNRVLRLLGPLRSPVLRPLLPCQGILLREVHNYVRPMRYAQRFRKERDLFFNPNPKPTRRSSFSDWNYNAEIYAFSRRLNEQFRDDLLRQAFTERSYVVTEKLRQEEVGLDTTTLDLRDNEVLAVEGKSILESTLKPVLRNEFPLFPDAGIEALCKFLTSETVMAYISSHIGTTELILSDDYPPSEATLCHTFQAIVSALEKSSGAKRTKAFIEDFVVTHLYDKNVNEIWEISHPWKMLTDIMTGKGETIEPRLIRESGRNTLLSVFVVGIYTGEKKLIGTGIGETVEIAQEMGARDSLSGIFGTRDPIQLKFTTERENPAVIPKIAAKSQ